jgi:hypothetical protein
MGGGRDVGAPGGLGIEIGKASLNLQPGDGVGVVGGPDLGAKAEHTQIKPVAAGRTALQQNYRLSVQGGNKNLGYKLSYSYFDEEGAMVYSGNEKHNISLNLNS